MNDFLGWAARRGLRRENWGWFRRTTTWYCYTLAWAAAGCTDEGALPAAPVEAGQGSIARFVAPEVAAKLDADGKFVLGAAAAPVSLRHTTISKAQATEFAALFARDFGPFMRPTLESDRGRSIDFAHLTPCERVFYAEPPLPELPDAVSDVTRRDYGPWYLVTLCDASGSAAVSVATSAYATDLRIVKGRLSFPAHHGGEFRITGIPITLGALPLPPEDAVRKASESGALVADVPRLVATIDDYPQMSRWKIKLDRTVTVRRENGGLRQTREDLHVWRRGFRDSVMAQLPAETQPTSITLEWWVPQPVGSKAIPPQTASLTIPLRAGYPVRFERAILPGRN